MKLVWSGFIFLSFVGVMGGGGGGGGRSYSDFPSPCPFLCDYQISEDVTPRLKLCYSWALLILNKLMRAWDFEEFDFTEEKEKLCLNWNIFMDFRRLLLLFFSLSLSEYHFRRQDFCCLKNILRSAPSVGPQSSVSSHGSPSFAESR